MNEIQCLLVFSFPHSLFLNSQLSLVSPKHIKSINGENATQDNYSKAVTLHNVVYNKKSVFYKSR